VSALASPSRAAPGGLRRNAPYLFGLAPAAILLAVFFVGPALWAAYASMTNTALVGIDSLALLIDHAERRTRVRLAALPGEVRLFDAVNGAALA